MEGGLVEKLLMLAGGDGSTVRCLLKDVDGFAAVSSIPEVNFQVGWSISM